MAVDRKIRRDGSEIETVSQPLPLPAGVEDSAVGFVASRAGVRALKTAIGAGNLEYMAVSSETAPLPGLAAEKRVDEEKEELTASLTLKLMVEGNTSFALDLYSRLSRDNNLFFSPYSISTALAMTGGGARGNTAGQMSHTLHFPFGLDQLHPAFAELGTRLNAVQNAGQVQLYVANSLWPQKGHPFRPAYLSLVRENYGATITPVDYFRATEAARQTINKWVEAKTRNKIEHLIQPGDLDPATILVLVNAIYFKGSWATRFEVDQTRETDFTLPSGEKTPVAMMHQVGTFGYRELKGVQVLELPYAGGQMSMLVLLPREKDGLPQIEAGLNAGSLKSWLAGLSTAEVQVYLPRFKLAWGPFDLTDHLKALGIQDAFVPGTADFSGMDGTRNLFIDLVLHQAMVEVNEEGTEAAAATGVTMRLSAAHPHIFRADHPFLFLIRDNSSGSVLFMGRVVDPAAEAE